MFRLSQFLILVGYFLLILYSPRRVLSQEDNLNFCDIPCVTNIYKRFCGDAKCTTGASDYPQRFDLCSEKCTSAVIGEVMSRCLTQSNPERDDWDGVQTSTLEEIHTYCTGYDIFLNIDVKPQKLGDVEKSFLKKMFVLPETEIEVETSKEKKTDPRKNRSRKTKPGKGESKVHDKDEDDKDEKEEEKEEPESETQVEGDSKRDKRTTSKETASKSANSKTTASKSARSEDKKREKRSKEENKESETMTPPTQKEDKTSKDKTKRRRSTSTSSRDQTIEDEPLEDSLIFKEDDEVQEEAIESAASESLEELENIEETLEQGVDDSEDSKSE
eukprot:g4308.t1